MGDPVHQDVTKHLNKATTVDLGCRFHPNPKGGLTVAAEWLPRLEKVLAQKRGGAALFRPSPAFMQ